jgi:ABC-type transport system involved in Fe-S cluster assembly fused permease/ATPase subunit
MTNSEPRQLAGFREVARLFWSTASSYVRRRIGLALVLIVTSSAITALAPVALKFVVDGFTGHATIGGLSVLALVGLYILSQWLGRVIGDLRTLIHGQADRRMYRTLSDRLFSHVMSLPLRFHLERQTGAVNETLSNGLQGFQMVLQTSIYTLLPVIVQLGTVAFVLVKIDQPIFLALFIVAIGCYGTAFAYGAMRITRTARGASSAQVEARAVMTDSILNYETVKYFTAEPIVRERLDSALGRTEFEWLRFYKSRMLNGFLVSTIFASFLGVTIFYAARQVMSGAMTVGDFVLVNTYMIQLVMPLEMIGYAMQSLSQGYAFLEKMLDLFREKTEPETGPQPVDENSHPAASLSPSPALGGGGSEEPGPGELAFENVQVSYQADRMILRDVTFNVPPGHTLGIVGSSGSGKTSTIRMLFRLYEPDSGRILLDGVPIAEIPLASLRSAIAVVPQDTVLFNESIGYNIGFGRIGSTQAEIEQAAEVAHLHHFIAKLPEGYRTRVGERGLKLSGGEKQRVSIARAALKRPRIYVFDEATSSLDSRTEHEILKNIRDLSRHATTLIIAHRLSTVVHADEIVVMDEGSIVERGTHAALLALNGRYAELWRAQQPKKEEAVV